MSDDELLAFIAKANKLHFEEKLSLSAIAERFGIAKSTLVTRMERARTIEHGRGESRQKAGLQARGDAEGQPRCSQHRGCVDQ
jgi:hypothetical protein